MGGSLLKDRSSRQIRFSIDLVKMNNREMPIVIFINYVRVCESRTVLLVYIMLVNNTIDYNSLQIEQLNLNFFF